MYEGEKGKCPKDLMFKLAYWKKNKLAYCPSNGLSQVAKDKKQLEERKQAITNTDGGAEERASNISRSLIGKIV